MQSVLKSFYISILCVLCLLGLLTFGFSAYFVFSSSWEQFALMFSLNRTIYYFMFYGSVALVFIITIIASLISHIRELESKQK
jgi:TRAP-type C4-dicarboxylate transport system permease small subunit